MGSHRRTILFVLIALVLKCTYFCRLSSDWSVQVLSPVMEIRMTCWFTRLGAFTHECMRQKERKLSLLFIHTTMMCLYTLPRARCSITVLSFPLLLKMCRAFYLSVRMRCISTAPAALAGPMRMTRQWGGTFRSRKPCRLSSIFYAQCNVKMFSYKCIA